MTTHPHIDRLAAIGSEELSVDHVAEVLQRQRMFVYSLIQLDELEGTRERAQAGKPKRQGAEGREQGAQRVKHRHSYVITAAALLRYLVKHTSGDKAVILSAIKTRFPQHAHLFEGEGVKGQASTVKAGEPPPGGGSYALPDNVIPMRRGRGQGAGSGEQGVQMELFGA